MNRRIVIAGELFMPDANGKVPTWIDAIWSLRDRDQDEKQRRRDESWRIRAQYIAEFRPTPLERALGVRR